MVKQWDTIIKSSVDFNNFVKNKRRNVLQFIVHWIEENANFFLWSLSLLKVNIKHPSGRALTSDRFANSFIKVIDQNIFQISIRITENKFLVDNSNKTM